MWSMTNFHRKSTVRGEADNWVHGSRKEVPPYYAQNNYSSTYQQGPTGRATIFCKKMFPLYQLGPTRSAALLRTKK